MGLRSYVITRILLTIPTLLLLLTMVFLVIRVLPGDPVALHFEKKADPETMDRMRHILGLDKPLWNQYADYIVGIVDLNYLFAHGYPNLGKSMQTTSEDVGAQIFSAFPATLELAIYSMIIACVSGILLGVWSSKSYGSIFDHSVRILGTVSYAIPVFLLGIVLQLIFGVYLKWLPTGLRIGAASTAPRGLNFTFAPVTYDFTYHVLFAIIAAAATIAAYLTIMKKRHRSPKPRRAIAFGALITAAWAIAALASWPTFSAGRLHLSTGLFTIDSLLEGNAWKFADSAKALILPSLTLGAILSGIFIRLTRNNMLETLRLDFVTAARARGLTEDTVTYDYALRNAFLPILTMMGLQFALLLGGAILTETTFSWPGLGTYIVQRIRFRDYTAIQGAVVMFGLFVTLVSLIVDLLYAYFDPRVRL